MPNLFKIRFNKNGDYGNKIFIANMMKEPKEFQLLEKFYNQLKETFPDSFLPIFCNRKHKYATIRFKTDTKFDKNDVYSLKFDVKKKIINDKTYVNCMLKKYELISKAEAEDSGEDIEFNLSD